MSWIRKRERTGRMAAVAGAPPGETTAAASAPPGRALKRRRTPINPVPPDHMEAADFKDGLQLAMSASRCVAKGIEAYGRPTVNTEQTVVVGGPAADMLLMVENALNTALKDEDVGAQLNIVGACDKDAGRMRWVGSVASHLSRPNLCTFTDTGAMGTPTAQCGRHNSLTCAFPTPVDGMIAAFSSKEVARAGSMAEGLRPGSRHRTSQGQSDAQAHAKESVKATLAWVERLAPEWLLMYDTDPYVEQAESLNVLLAGIGTLGYDVQPVVADGSNYGLPYSGGRSMLVGILTPTRKLRIDTYDNFFRRVLELFGAFKMAPSCVESVAFPRSHHVVQGALARAIEVEPIGMSK